MSAAEKAALDAFFKGKRGERVLIEPVAVALRDYFAAKGTTLPELATARPVDPTKVQDFQDEWSDAAAAAGVSDRLDARNVVRWIMEDVGGGLATGSSRLGKAAAIAEALVKKGLAVDRVAEMAIQRAGVARIHFTCRQSRSSTTRHGHAERPMEQARQPCSCAPTIAAFASTAFRRPSPSSTADRAHAAVTKRHVQRDCAR